MVDQEMPAVELSRRGDVSDEDVEYVMKRIEAVARHVGVPILHIRIRLTRETGPGVRPAIAQATFDLNGELLRAQVAADSMSQASDLLADRLRDQIQHRAERRRSRRAVGRAELPGEWSRQANNSMYADVPIDEREVVRIKTFNIDPVTPDEAAADMEELDHDFWLFRDLASDADAVLERLDDGTYRLRRAKPAQNEDGPAMIELTIVDSPPPLIPVNEAISRLEASGQRYSFFINPDTGRGNVLYRRYDGHYGRLSPL